MWSVGVVLREQYEQDTEHYDSDVEIFDFTGAKKNRLKVSDKPYIILI